MMNCPKRKSSTISALTHPIDIKLVGVNDEFELQSNRFFIS